MIGNRFPTTADEAARQAAQQQAAQTGSSGVSILMDLIRRLMEEGDYEGLAKVLPQMYPAEAETGAPPGPVLPEPEVDEGYGMGESFPSGMVTPMQYPRQIGEGTGAGSYPNYPLNEGETVGSYSNPFTGGVGDLAGVLAQEEGMGSIPPAGVPGYAAAPPMGELPPIQGGMPGSGFMDFGGGLMSDINQFNPVHWADVALGDEPIPPMEQPGIRNPGPVAPLPMDLLMLLGLA